jgi:hypothetical protein
MLLVMTKHEREVHVGIISVSEERRGAYGAGQVRL